MLEYEPPFGQAVAISMPVTSGSSRAPLAATTFVFARIVTLTATGFPQLFWNEGNSVPPDSAANLSR